MSERAGQGQEDLQIIAELKGIWASYQGNPEVVLALRAALRDGRVTEQELLALRSSVAMALRSSPSKTAEGPEPRDDLGGPGRLELEAQSIQAAFEPGSEPGLAASDILKDGRVTPDEILRLRQIVSAAREAEQEFQAAPAAEKPKPAPRAIPFPTLTMKTPWRSNKGEDEDSGWGK